MTLGINKEPPNPILISNYSRPLYHVQQEWGLDEIGSWIYSVSPQNPNNNPCLNIEHVKVYVTWLCWCSWFEGCQGLHVQDKGMQLRLKMRVLV